MGMYQTLTHLGMRGQLTREEGNSFETRGGSPPSRNLSQPNLQGGGLGGPPGGLLDGGRNSGANQVPAQPIGPISPPVNRGLKGTALAIFDGNRKHTKQFTQEFTLYRMINQDSPTICSTYTRTALALFFMRGLVINNWVLQYWTSKGNKFYSTQNRLFEGNWVLGLFLERLKTSKAQQSQSWTFSASLRIILAPNCPQKIYFRCYKICCLCLSSTV